MDAAVFVAVLFAAACHAGWNAAIKRGLDPLGTTMVISIGAAFVSALLVPIVGWPAVAAWPWCIASVLIHLIYFAALIESYRAGDMGQVYPIARGAAPLLTATATTLFVGERLGILGWGGILLLVAGVMLLSLHGGRGLARLDRRAVSFPCSPRSQYAAIP
jgi:drug/metabolite transporter (DMT)-like permease